MKRFSNVSYCNYSPMRKQSSEIDWNKQMLYDKLYPGKVFYKEKDVLIRSNNGSLFKHLDSVDIMQIYNHVQTGDMLLLKDTVDSSFARHINDVLIVERVDDDGRLHGKFRMTEEYINLLPELDLIVNLSKGNRVIKMIKARNERSMER